MGGAAGVYAAGVAKNEELSDLFAHCYDAYEDPFYNWFIKRDWAENLLNGYWDHQEYREEIASTMIDSS